jgi:hypothetical protein
MITKQALPLNFANGLDTKTDPKQVAFGRFLVLENSIFTKGGLLQKRNGYGQLTALPDTSSTCLTTFNGNLTAVGESIVAYNDSNESWVSRGNVSPVELSALSLIRNSINQIQCDAAVASNGLVCTVYTETNNGTTDYKYAVANSVTGQNIVIPTLIPAGLGAITGSPRVFVLGVYFIIAFTNEISGVYHLQYIAVSTLNPSVVKPNTDIAANYAPASTVAWDAVVTNNNLYIAYNTTSGGQSIKAVYLTDNLTLSAPVTFSGYAATMMALAVDTTNPTNPIIYISFYSNGSSTGYTVAIGVNLTTVFTPKEIISSGTILNLASGALNGICTVFYEVSNAYGYDSGILTNYISGIKVSKAGVVGSPYVVVRSVGLASKAFIVDGTIYFLSAYQSPYQSTYFLINGSLSVQAVPIVVAKLAYENGGGYLLLGLPCVTVIGNEARIAYLYKDLIEALSTNSNTQQTTTGGIYSQTGINLVSFVLGALNPDAAEIGSNLQLSGGFLWNYDGYLPVENNFFLWPDSIEATWSATGGSMAAQPDGSTNTDAYYYQWTYEWSDNQGNVYRSAPSIPVAVTTTGSGSTGSITLHVPYLRLTYKVPNPLKLVLYRWSVAHQTYYQVTSITAAQLNSTTSDYLTYVDTLADSSIIGNNIIYTTGGVLEDVNGPGSNIVALFDNRLWLVDAEDQNLLWFSKQVIEATPVEMSDLLTIYVAPTTAAQGSTGPITALAPMDDKLIIFKENAIYYINGTGPDNTGANSQYSQPVFINSTVGCTNQQSIVFMPQGLMFQSDKGIWLLGRDLSTNYIGAPVEAFNSSEVQSAVNIPATNQVRFTLNTGQTLMYDYYYGQWGTFVNVPAISSCIFQDLHTFLNSAGAVYQETPGEYLDGSSPVLMTLTTSWIQLAGLQGYQRAYFFYLLGTYFSPHKLNLSIAYDYVSSPIQNTIITPTNYSPAYGSPSMPVYGQISPYGGGSDDSGAPSNIEQWRVFLSKQRCTSFQITLQEIYDSSFGAPAGAGLTLSGLNLIVGVKKGWRPQPSATSAGSVS